MFIIQDSYGFLWFATQNGIDMYDGYEFKVYKNEPGDSTSIGGNNTYGLAEDKDHNIWVAHKDGVSMFDRYTKSFRNYNLNQFAALFLSNSPKAVDIFCDPQNNVWVGSLSAGLLKFNRKSGRFVHVNFDTARIKNSNRFYDVIKGMCEYNGTLWVNSWKYGLCYYDTSRKMLETQDFKPVDNAYPYNNFKERGTYLFPDQNGYLWILTEHGIYKYYSKDSTLSSVYKITGKNFGNSVFFPCLAQDHDGNIWIGSAALGLLKFDGISNTYHHINFNEIQMRPSTSGPSSMISSICFDKSGIMWIGSMLNGVFKYDKTREPFVTYKYDPKNPNSLSGSDIMAVTASTLHNGLVYVGTRGAGFNKFYTDKNKIERVPLKLKNDMFGGSVRSILENKDGSLYLGTWGAGLYKYFPDGRLKLVANYDSLSEESLSNPFVRVLVRNEKGQIWVGTGNGLNLYDPSTNKTERIYSESNREYPYKIMHFIRSKENSPGVIQSILKVGNSQNLTKEIKIDRPGNYLVVCGGEGVLANSVNEFDFGWVQNSRGDTVWSAKKFADSYYLGGASKNRITAGLVKLTPGIYKLRYVSDDSHSYGNWNAIPPADSALWGIQVVELKAEGEKKAESLFSNLKSQFLVSGSDIKCIHIDRDGIVWIGTGSNGLTRYDPKTDKTKYYRVDPKKENSIGDNSVLDIYEDGNGILWLATQKGLDKFNPATEKFTIYNESNGLPTNVLASILKDDSGNLWISSNNGISRMTTDKSTGRVGFVNYDAKDGLGGEMFYQLVAAKDNNGKLYFGGNNGLVEFSTSKFNKTPPIVHITDVKLSNQSVTKMGEDDPLDTPVMNAKSITLSNSQNDVSFDFDALHYSRPDKNKYAHMLVGYDKAWSYDNRRFAIYTNLDPGNYVFKVKASNCDGIWNTEGASMKITILPPWWRTGWAYAGYVIIFIGLVFSADRLQRKRLLAKERERQKINEMELRAQTAELQAKALEAESRALELENERKTKELEEARQLQLSLLPKQLPELPHLDIAVYMKTATEVGGDYYDFHVGMDGTLTVVLGDATGHGMKAGTMVTAAKSLFNSYASNPDIMFTFHEMSRCIKQMHFHMLSMCLAMLKISGNKMKMTSAGMPPVIIYRKNDRTIEEHVMKGMPLGTIDKFPYDVRETTLKPGDTLLMLSDGLPELHNDEKEMFGYKRVRNVFEDVAEKSPEEIIEHLKNQGSKWVNDKEPEDDVTFVVIKVKGT